MVVTANRINFEDLSAADKVLDQRGTPFWEALRNGKVLENHLLYSQAIDSMGKRRKGGVPERQDVKGFEGGKSTKLWARGERFQRNPAVSTETEEFGGNSASQLLKDYNAQVRAKTIDARRDINYTILSDQESQDDDGLTGYFFRGLGRTFNDGSTGAATSTGGASPTSYATDGTTPDLAFNDQQTAIPVNLRTPAAQIYDGDLDDLVESILTDMMENRWRHSGMMQEFTLWCAGSLKRHISDNFGKYVADKTGYTATNIQVQGASTQRKLVTTGIDVMQGDFGSFTIELEPWMPTTQRGYGVEMSEAMRRVRYLLRHRELENKGGGRRGLIDSILSAWFGDPRKGFKICPSSEVAAVVDFED